MCFQVTTILRSAVTKKPVSIRPTMVSDRHSVPTFISSCLCLQVFFAQYTKAQVPRRPLREGANLNRPISADAGILRPVGKDKSLFSPNK